MGFDGRLQWRRYDPFKLRAKPQKRKKCMFYRDLEERPVVREISAPHPKFAIRPFLVRRTIFEQAFSACGFGPRSSTPASDLRRLKRRPRDDDANSGLRGDSSKALAIGGEFGARSCLPPARSRDASFGMLIALMMASQRRLRFAGLFWPCWAGTQGHKHRPPCGALGAVVAMPMARTSLSPTGPGQRAG